MDADPSMDAIAGPYAAAFNHYVREELGYQSDLPYEQLTSRVQPWSFKDFEGRPIDVAPKLERAMRANIEHRYYEAGHMMYVHEPSRLQQSEDLADFVTRASRA
jgi:carboxypeptidase C (cathepsin A)